MRRHALIIFCYALALAATFIMLRIEWLNVRAGGRLPNREYRDNDPSQGVVTWRAAPSVVVERAWRARRSIGDRPLTAAEHAHLDPELQKEEANGSLRDFVATFGTLQYLLAPTLIVASIVMIRRKRIASAILPLIVGVAGCVMMFARAYFSSLGN